MSGDDGLRSAVESVILDAWRALPEDATFGQAAARFADAVLALPEMAALRAKAAAADRVRELAEEWAKIPQQDYLYTSAARIRRVLDGPPPC